MNPFKNAKTFKVFETNNMTALRTGHMVAQAPFYGHTGQAGFVENGFVMYLKNVDGELQLVKPEDAAQTDQPFIHYTEELMPYDYTELKHFAVETEGEGNDEVSYPRALALYVGDTFTTNNVKGNIEEGYYHVNDDGEFETGDGGQEYVGPVFHGKESTLPDGETDAVELTVLSLQ